MNKFNNQHYIIIIIVIVIIIMSMDACIKTYFENSFTFEEILEFLRTRDGYNISLSTLKRHLKKWP